MPAKKKKIEQNYSLFPVKGYTKRWSPPKQLLVVRMPAGMSEAEKQARLQAAKLAAGI